MLLLTPAVCQCFHVLSMFTRDVQNLLQYDTAKNSRAALYKSLTRPRKQGQAASLLLIRSSYEDSKLDSRKVTHAMAQQGLAAADAYIDCLDNGGTGVALQPPTDDDTTAAATTFTTTTTATAVIKLKVYFELASVTRRMLPDRTVLARLLALARKDKASITAANLDRPLRRGLEWDPLMSAIEEIDGTELFTAVPSDGAAVSGELPAHVHAQYCEATAVQHGNYTKLQSTPAHYSTRSERIRQQHPGSVGADLVAASMTNDVRVVAAAAALKAKGALRLDKTAVLCGRTSYATQGADVPAQRNPHSSSNVVQVEDAAAVHKALMGNSSQQCRTVTLLFSSDAGRSTSGYVAKVIMAVTNSGDSAQLSDVHRAGRGRLAVRPLCGDGRAADRFIIIRYPPGELSLLFEVTLLGT
jgi:hypothetical protein